MVSQPPNYPPQKQYLSSVFFYNFSEIMIIGIYTLIYIMVYDRQFCTLLSSVNKKILDTSLLYKERNIIA